MGNKHNNIYILDSKSLLGYLNMIDDAIKKTPDKDCIYIIKNIFNEDDNINLQYFYKKITKITNIMDFNNDNKITLSDLTYLKENILDINILIKLINICGSLISIIYDENKNISINKKKYKHILWLTLMYIIYIPLAKNVIKNKVDRDILINIKNIVINVILYIMQSAYISDNIIKLYNFIIKKTKKCVYNCTYQDMDIKNEISIDKNEICIDKNEIYKKEEIINKTKDMSKIKSNVLYDVYKNNKQELNKTIFSFKSEKIFNIKKKYKYQLI
jgi:hypothetical protein